MTGCANEATEEQSNCTQSQANLPWHGVSTWNKKERGVLSSVLPCTVKPSINFSGVLTLAFWTFGSNPPPSLLIGTTGWASGSGLVHWESYVGHVPRHARFGISLPMCSNRTDPVCCPISCFHSIFSHLARCWPHDGLQRDFPARLRTEALSR